MTIEVRWMIRRDLRGVMAIESATGSGVTEAEIVALLRERGTIGMVALSGDHVVGWMVYLLRSNTLDVLHLTVDPDWRRSGIGSQMIEKLRSRLIYPRRPYLRIGVRESNLGAQLFLRACGLRAVRVDRGHHEDTGEDQYVFRGEAPVKQVAERVETFKEQVP